MRSEDVRSYLVYRGSMDLYIEMGMCTAVPRKGDLVEINGKRFVVASVQWSVFDGQGDAARPECHPVDYYPQQCATVTLSRRR